MVDYRLLQTDIVIRPHTAAVPAAHFEVAQLRFLADSFEPDASVLKLRFFLARNVSEGKWSNSKVPSLTRRTQSPRSRFLKLRYFEVLSKIDIAKCEPIQ